MKVTFIEEQAECIRFLIGTGMMHLVKPSPGKPGCNGLFPLDTPDPGAATKFALVDLYKGIYQIAILSETSTQDAVAWMLAVNECFNGGNNDKVNVRIGFAPHPVPHTN